MKKCLSCNKTKFFLKLIQGLCPECFEEYRKCEEEYKNLIRKASVPTADANNLISAIKILSKKMKQFDSADTILKSSNCNDLLKVVYEINNISLNLTINKIASNNIEETIKSEVKLVPDAEINEEEIQKKAVLQNSFDSPKSDLLEAPIKSADESEKAIEIKPIKQSINPELYIKAQDFISKINNAVNDVDEQAYYTFLLNDIYKESLKNSNITTIDDIEIEKFINLKFNKLALTLNIDRKDLYSYYNYVAFSLQTTGINCAKNDILEIAAVKVRFGQVQDSFKTLVNSGKSLNLALQEKTGISNKDISKAPPLEICLENFKNFVSDLKLISHNNNFYSSFLNYYYKKVFNENFKNSSECSLRLFRKRFTKYYGEPPKKFDLDFCENELLDMKVINDIKHEKSTALQSAMATFYLYEVIKRGYK